MVTSKKWRQSSLCPIRPWNLYRSEIAFTFQSKELAKKLGDLGIWGRAAGRTAEDYEYIFFVTNFKKVKLQKSEVNEITGYGRRVPRGPMRVKSPEVTERFIALLEGTVPTSISIKPELKLVGLLPTPTVEKRFLPLDPNIGEKELQDYIEDHPQVVENRENCVLYS